MTALSIITLQEAKDYLKVDFADEDTLITSAIETAVALVERHTLHLLYPRTETRHVRSGYEIYDYPYEIDALGDSISYSTEKRTLFDRIHFNGGTAELSLTVGYATKDLIPAPLLTGCYKLITYLYIHRDLQPATIPADVQVFLQPYRRYASI